MPPLASYGCRAPRRPWHIVGPQSHPASPSNPITDASVKKSAPAVSPDAYVAALTGWRRACVESLRAAVRAGTKLDEVIKWGHLVYLGEGPVLLIRAEEERVLLGFWRGQRLLELEPRLKPGGKYEMATLELREGTSITKAAVRRLTARAVELDAQLGDPTHDARPAATTVAPRRKRGGASNV